LPNKPIVSKQANSGWSFTPKNQFLIMYWRKWNLYTIEGVKREAVSKNPWHWGSRNKSVTILTIKPALQPYRQGRNFSVQATVLYIVCDSRVHNPAYPSHHLLHIPPIWTNKIWDTFNGEQEGIENGQENELLQTNLTNAALPIYLLG
jgi:hypothetical protein